MQSPGDFRVATAVGVWVLAGRRQPDFRREPVGRGPGCNQDQCRLTSDGIWHLPQATQTPGKDDSP